MTVNLTLSEVAAFKKELLYLLEQLQTEVTEEMGPQMSTGVQTLEVHDSGEDADATADFMLKVESLSRHNEEIAECLSALSRINAGEFGLCTDCGEEIELSRLKACPTAARCIRCQSLYEQGLQKSA
ncbi:TraR/DksA family transcriptional regulator [Neptuniibacter marinus]|uniref:TraR/DksA family transcriptional regulator n=1 Tax=Neptuniibacter marinus TaxID=1806670 RepID=UPI00082F5C71|nr:TraR/DksA family transcriptional regulator [Neptuniibacter marinus]